MPALFRISTAIDVREQKLAEVFLAPLPSKIRCLRYKIFGLQGYLAMASGLMAQWVAAIETDN